MEEVLKLEIYIMNYAKRTTPSKEQLIELYYNKNMTLDEIGKQLSYADRQPINRLFKKYGIITKSKSIIANEKYLSNALPTKQELECTLDNMSISNAAKYYKINRGKVSKLIKDYQIDTNYFKYKHFKELINSKKYYYFSAIEIAKDLNIPVGVINYYRKTYLTQTYTIDTIIKKLKEYDLNNRGLTSILKANDISLYNSILKHTNDHNLQSKKYSERIYRLFHEYESDQFDVCKYCLSKLKFYTFEQGYGTENKFCKKCLSKHCGFGVSIISQKLFNELYNNLSPINKMHCRYSDLNSELLIPINHIDVITLQHLIDISKLNARFYKIDFALYDKIIEFDGTYWHRKEPERDIIKNIFLNYKGYKVLRISEKTYRDDPKKVLEECINFLNQ